MTLFVKHKFLDFTVADTKKSIFDGPPENPVMIITWFTPRALCSRFEARFSFKYTTVEQRSLFPMKIYE